MRAEARSCPRPTGRGVGGAAVVVGLVILAVGTGTTELVALTVAVGLPVIVAPFAASRRARRVRLRLAVDSSVSPALSVVGGDITLRIGVTNRSEGAAPALWVEGPGRRWRRRGDETAGGRDSAPSWLVPSGLITLPAPAGRTRAVFASAVASGRRGVFVLPARRSWVLDPFGLVGVPGPVVPAVSAVVYPAADRATQWPSAVVDGSSSDAPVARPGAGRDGPGELVGIRPYVEGDRLSLLHWPARARYGAWFVRQFGPEEGVETKLVLDDRAGVHRPGDFEAMLAGAHGLVELWFDDGRTVELCTLSGRSVTLAPVPVGLEEARLLLATVMPRTARAAAGIGGGTVMTTGTGARSLPEGLERIVVGR